MDLVPADERTAEVIREMLPEFQNMLNRALISQAFLVSRDKTGTARFYVNRTGLLIFMEKKFRGKGARYSIRVEPLKEEEEQRLRRSLGFGDRDPFVAIKGIVEVVYEDGTRELFEDIGTASPRDCHHGRLVEMASTRATNRAMRLATSLGFTSVEELPDREEKKPEASEPTKEPEKAEPDKVTDKQLRMIHALITELAKASETPREEIVNEIKSKYGVEHSHDLTKQQASELIEELQQQLAAVRSEDNG